jgi:hypothetical protein
VSSLKVLTASPSLSGEQVDQIKAAAKLLRYKFEARFSEKTTHLIVPASDDKVSFLESPF